MKIIAINCLALSSLFASTAFASDKPLTNTSILAENQAYAFNYEGYSAPRYSSLIEQMREALATQQDINHED